MTNYVPLRTVNIFVCFHKVSGMCNCLVPFLWKIWLNFCIFWFVSVPIKQCSVSKCRKPKNYTLTGNISSFIFPPFANFTLSKTSSKFSPAGTHSILKHNLQRYISSSSFLPSKTLAPAAGIPLIPVLHVF